MVCVPEVLKLAGNDAAAFASRGTKSEYIGLSMPNPTLPVDPGGVTVAVKAMDCPTAGALLSGVTEIAVPSMADRDRRLLGQTVPLAPPFTR